MADGVNPQDIFDAMRDAIFVAERDSLRILRANQAAQTLTGQPLDALCARTLPEVLSEEDRALFTELVMGLSAEDRAQMRAKMLSGDSAYVTVTVETQLAQINRMACAICVARDVGSRRVVRPASGQGDMLYRSLFEAIPDLFFRIKRDGTYVDFKVPDNIGLVVPTPEQIIGKNVADMVPPHVTEAVMPKIERAIETGELQTAEYWIDEPSGRHEYEARFVASLEDEIVALVRDITNRKRAENLLRAQRDLGMALSAETTLESALERVVDTAIQVAGMDCGGIYLAEPDTGAFCLAFHRGLPDPFVESAWYFAPTTPQSRLITAGAPVYTNYERLSIPVPDARRREGLRALAVVPVHHGSQIVACINVASHSLPEVPSYARDALELIASQIGSAIARLRAEEALRENEETTRALLNALGDSAVLIDRNHTVLTINEAAARLFDSTADQMVGRKIVDYLPPAFAFARQTYIQAALQTGAPVNYEDEFNQTLFAATVYPLFDSKGHVNRLAIYGRDITQQKQYEAALRRKDRLLEGVAQATNVLLAMGILEDAVNEALKILGQGAEADRAFVFESHPHPITGKLVRSMRYGWAVTTGRIDRLPFLNRDWEVDGAKRAYDILFSGDIISGPTRGFPELNDPTTESTGVRSLLIVPIFLEKEFWGFIGLDDHRSDRQWLGEEVSILKTMAASVGVALERHQMEQNWQQERALAETLGEVGMALTSTLDLNEVLGRILEQVRHVVPYDAANVMLIEEGIARVERTVGYEANVQSAARLEGATFQVDQRPLLRKVIQSRKPYVVSNVDEDPNWTAVEGDQWIKSWLGAPIVYRGEVVGTFSLDAASPGLYGPKHAGIIAPFVRQAAIAYENAALFANIQALERFKSTMIRMASHDLRSPLTRIRESIARLRDQEGFSELSKYSDLISEAAREMAQIIDDILSIERIEAQHRSAKTVVWRELIEQSVAAIRADADANRHQLDVGCESGLPSARGDPAQLRQAIINLLGNAIKYTPPGGHIILRAYQKDYGGEPTVAVEVEDNGIGIPYERQANLFEPFYRAEQAGAEDITGTGLGLSVVKAAVEYHQGSVYFDSAHDRGSLFGFRIPV